MLNVKIKLFFVVSILFIPNFSWGIDDDNTEDLQRVLFRRELSKDNFFDSNKDIKLVNPLPRPSDVELSLIDLEPEKLANLITFDYEELKRRDFFIFHGVNPHSLTEEKFNELYGDYIECENTTQKKMLFAGLWSNLCISGSLIHPSKSPTYNPQGLILRVPYQLIYMTDYKDMARVTHLHMKYNIHSLDSVIRRKSSSSPLLSRDNCFESTQEHWHNEIQFLPEAVVDGTKYSISVLGLWARDQAKPKMIYRDTWDSVKQDFTMQEVEWTADTVSPENLTWFKEISKELELPLVLSSTWTLEQALESE